MTDLDTYILTRPTNWHGGVGLWQSVDAVTSSVSANRFGAANAGVSAPLSGVYRTLAEAQAVYPHATSLDDELDWCAIQAAVNYLDTQSGGVVELSADHYIVNKPITIENSVRVILRGAGARTQISTLSTGLEAIVIFRNASQGGMQDITVKINGGASATYGVLVTASTSTQGVSLYNCTVDGGSGTLQDGFAVGCDTVADVAQTSFFHCTASGCTGAGFRLGNGTAGNVLDTRMYSIVATQCARGVYFDGSAGQVWGFGVDSNTTADFSRSSMCSSPILIEGGRSESSKRFWDTSGGTFAQPVVIRDVMVVDFTDVAGNVVNHATASPITIEDSTFRNGAADVTMTFGTGASVCSVTARNVFTEGTPFSTNASNSWRSMDIANCWTVNSSGVPTVGTGVNKRGHGIAHQRITTGEIAAGASALVTVTWSIPFGGTSYTVVASVLDATTAAASLRVVHVESRSETAVVVRVENTAAGALTGTLHVMAMQD